MPTPSRLGFAFRLPSAISLSCAVRESQGFATTVSDDAILAARDEAAQNEGLLLCPEGAATLAAYKKELASGRIAADETAVLFNCATGLKYDLPPVDRRLDRDVTAEQLAERLRSNHRGQ